MARTVLELADKILDLVASSGLTIVEAQCAIQAASMLVRVEPEPVKTAGTPVAVPPALG